MTLVEWLTGSSLWLHPQNEVCNCRKTEEVTYDFSPDQLAAHSLLSELRTRIATQPLPYQYGIEARALESLWEVFGLARKAMKDNPGCAAFAKITTEMLNVNLRPFTAKWHRAYEAGVLNSRDGANEFRADLASVRTSLAAFAEALQEMAYGSISRDAITPDVISDAEVAKCFAPVKFGVDIGQVSNAAQVNRSEAEEIAARRRNYGLATPADVDAVGLALSGGGIRSATFCLGVVQALAARGLMKDFDYLSTVSGGGYTGSFITSYIGAGREFSQIANPYGPDTEAVRLVRQNAKYLSVADLKRRWLMVIGTLAGFLLNLTAPIGLLAATAWLSNELAPWISGRTLDHRFKLARRANGGFCRRLWHLPSFRSCKICEDRHAWLGGGVCVVVLTGTADVFD